MVFLDSMTPNDGDECPRDNHHGNFVTTSDLEEILVDFQSSLLESVKEIVHGLRDKGNKKTKDKSEEESSPSSPTGTVLSTPIRLTQPFMMIENRNTTSVSRNCATNLGL